MTIETERDQPRFADGGQCNEQSVQTLSGPVWTEEAISRLLGAGDGYVHAIAALKQKIGSITAYRPINPRHVRMQAQREAVLKPLTELLTRFTEEHSRCREAYRQRAADRTAQLSTDASEAGTPSLQRTLAEQDSSK